MLLQQIANGEIMEKFKSESVEKLFEVVMNLSSIDECYKFFEDICDKKADFNNISSRVGYMCPIVVYI